ncbi:MAG TPA: response regulator [Chthoniobacteraceae bacterium]|jgi:signal transduction histidine kinase|nr:response regulator [Chthoniobacteraceae bacterium]
MIEFQTARLLIVDDQIANICLLRNVLNRLGFAQIESTTDPRETFGLLEIFQPDLIILDLNMPFLDGFSVMQQVGKTLAGAFLPILVITADATAATKRKALAGGASDLLTKPFEASEVFMRIRNLLQLRFTQLQLQNHNQLLEEKVAERTRDLKAAQQQVVAQERLRAFGEMAGGIVHDFNNTLMSIIGYSELLLQDEALISNISTVREFLTIMNTAGHDASHVISRLRDFYRPREVTDVFAPTNLNDIIEQAVPLTQPKWKDQALATGRVIKVEMDLAKVPLVLASPAELREVATNLIFNAVDAMPDGGTITITTRTEGAEVILEITDSGVGMTEEVRTRCLEPFFSTKGEKGTGLGLSMVFGVIKRHEGMLEIESVLGTGTTFRIRFPARNDSFAALRVDSGKIERALRVLVVDDEPIPRDIITKYLHADGHTAVIATHGQEAIDRFHEEPFDLLLTDHGMPGMNGVQLAAAVRQIRNNQPIILITGFSELGLEENELPPGVNLVVRKPVPQGEFRQALLTVFGPV